jgi:hypothetical protein
VGDPPEKLDRADGVVLYLQEGKDRAPRNYWTLFLLVKPGDAVDGKTFVVPPGGLFKQTERVMDRDRHGWFYPVGGVQVKSQTPGREPRAELFPKVTMRLEFGRRRGGRLPGRIYLSVDDAEKSFVAGSFEAVEEERNPRTGAAPDKVRPGPEASPPAAPGRSGRPP